MSLTWIGGAAALVCAASYLGGFALLVSLLAPLDYGSVGSAPAPVAAFIAENPGLMTVWNGLIYILNAMALALLVVALSEAMQPAARGWAAVTRGLGLIWATLVLGAGMIANIAVQRVALLHPEDPQAAAALWEVLHMVELGFGGGNEIAGATWIATASAAALRPGGLLPVPVAVLGLLTGLCGLLTLVPGWSGIPGAAFGLGAIAWFLCLGPVLLRLSRRGPAGQRAA